LFSLPSFSNIDSKIDINGNAAMLLVGKDEKVKLCYLTFRFTEQVYSLIISEVTMLI
jgi:hypothetical protein